MYGHMDNLLQTERALSKGVCSVKWTLGNVILNWARN